ncbi:TVP38/TMEM64 family protein [Blastococcus haudaquaticus]|uniref:TVP38/TMEM64 family membrane protein n=1 Tax=Blastococcus haudaquaticus TaxID=1938745 RepID=A0A286H694_9ACTN|nr:VTT domain-containing protein [Blastococcus haudaquaticus]SOE02996.1 Uncharacterized membrane protein YdjX, TVP38/TMEM64 family, SNARE-associated domain [Blastococcus haudaquaticus]
MTGAARAWVRAAVLGVLLVAGLVLALTVDLPGVPTVRTWLDGAGGVAWVGLALGVALVLMAPVPRSAVSVLVGVVAGFGPGTAVALAGGMLAGLAAFGLARLLGREAVTRVLGHRLEAVDRLMADRGFWAVLGGRLLPVVPFVLLSYGAGVTAVRLWPYALATAIGLVPGTLVQVGIGASAGVLAGSTTATAAPLVAAALGLFLLGILVVRRRRLPSGS